MPMPQQLAQIPVLRTRYPYAWKAIFHQQLQQQLASSRSVFCFRTRAALISDGLPIHSSKPSSASNRSNQRACPVASIPTRTLHLLLSVAVKLFGFAVPVKQSSFTAFSRVCIYKRDLLNARVIIQPIINMFGSFLPSLGR